MWFEMFAWETRGPKIFRNFPRELFPKTKALAANQGLYNGFLAAGLIWSILISDPQWSFNVATFFLSCVIIAGIYGGFGWLYWMGVAVFVGMLIYQHTIVKPTDLRKVNLAFMTANGIASVVFAIFVIADLFINS